MPFKVESWLLTSRRLFLVNNPPFISHEFKDLASDTLAFRGRIQNDLTAMRQRLNASMNRLANPYRSPDVTLRGKHRRLFRLQLHPDTF